jgi:RNase P subunit RPR2
MPPKVIQGTQQMEAHRRSVEVSRKTRRLRCPKCDHLTAPSTAPGRQAVQKCTNCSWTCKCVPLT